MSYTVTPVNVGVQSYARALRMQEWCVRHAGDRGFLLLVQHPPVYTAGRRIKDLEGQMPKGAEVFQVGLFILMIDAERWADDVSWAWTACWIPDSPSQAYEGALFHMID